MPLTPHSAIREGDYKLILDWHGRLKLFNIVEDRSETNNLAKQMPDKTKELFEKLMSWLDSNVKKTYWSKLNPDYNGLKESHDVPFVNLEEIYRNGGDVVANSN